jgi:uncharacterized protein (DUF2249 family)
MVIARTDRVSTVIGRDESLIEVFISLSPAFARLRNAGMRKVMSRLVTVEQAARMAGVDAEELVARLNARGSDSADDALVASTVKGAARAADGADESRRRNAGSRTKQEQNAMSSDAGPRPEALERVAPGHVVEVDVRAELRAGREPFSLIMAALRTVPPGGVFCVRAIFEPVPLYAVMKRQGLDHWTEKLADDDWRIWFHPPAVASSAARVTSVPGSEPVAPAPGGAASSEAEQDMVILDVRDLEPPEPMMRTLAALEQLPAGATLLQVNVRVPQFLLPMLEERGFTYDVREQESDLVRVFIRHST